MTDSERADGESPSLQGGEDVNDWKDDLERTLNDRLAFTPLNGREWCRKMDVDEDAFVEALDEIDVEVDWGISPIYPWRVSDE